MRILVSPASYWEIAIKISVGKYTLPFHHRDPFDRLMIAQAIVEQLPIVSNDAAVDPYPVTRIW